MSEKKNGEKKGGVPKIAIILVAVIIIMGAAFAAYILFFSKTPTKTADKATNTTASVDKVDIATISLDETIINLADTDSQKFAKVKVSFGYDSTNSKFVEELTSKTAVKTPILNDTVVKIIRSKKAGDLSGAGIDEVKKQILDTVNPYMQKGQFVSVYFDELVLQ